MGSLDIINQNVLNILPLDDYEAVLNNIIIFLK